MEVKKEIRSIFNKVLNSGIKWLTIEYMDGYGLNIRYQKEGQKKWSIFEDASLNDFISEDEKLKNLRELKKKLDNFLKEEKI